MKSSIPERPKDPQLAELHDLAMIIRDKNDNRRWLERYGWLFFGLSVVCIFLPGTTGTIIWLAVLMACLGFQIAGVLYDMKTISPLRRELYEKGTRIRRQNSYEIIDQVKAALPNKNVTINPDGNIGLTDKEEKA